jgi:hypothetical protein
MASSLWGVLFVASFCVVGSTLLFVALTTGHENRNERDERIFAEENRGACCLSSRSCVNVDSLIQCTERHTNSVSFHRKRTCTEISCATHAPSAAPTTAVPTTVTPTNAPVRSPTTPTAAPVPTSSPVGPPTPQPPTPKPPTPQPPTPQPPPTPAPTLSRCCCGTGNPNVNPQPLATCQTSVETCQQHCLATEVTPVSVFNASHTCVDNQPLPDERCLAVACCDPVLGCTLKTSEECTTTIFNTGMTFSSVNAHTLQCTCDGEVQCCCSSVPNQLIAESVDALASSPPNSTTAAACWNLQSPAPYTHVVTTAPTGPMPLTPEELTSGCRQLCAFGQQEPPGTCCCRNDVFNSVCADDVQMCVDVCGTDDVVFDPYTPCTPGFGAAACNVACCPVDGSGCALENIFQCSVPVSTISDTECQSTAELLPCPAAQPLTTGGVCCCGTGGPSPSCRATSTDCKNACGSSQIWAWDAYATCSIGQAIPTQQSSTICPAVRCCDAEQCSVRTTNRCPNLPNPTACKEHVPTSVGTAWNDACACHPSVTCCCDSIQFTPAFAYSPYDPKYMTACRQHGQRYIPLLGYRFPTVTPLDFCTTLCEPLINPGTCCCSDGRSYCAADWSTCADLCVSINDELYKFDPYRECNPGTVSGDTQPSGVCSVPCCSGGGSSCSLVNVWTCNMPIGELGVPCDSHCACPQPAGGLCCCPGGDPVSSCQADFASCSAHCNSPDVAWDALKPCALGVPEISPTQQCFARTCCFKAPGYGDNSMCTIVPNYACFEVPGCVVGETVCPPQ